MLCGNGKVWPGSPTVCLIQSSVAELNAVLGEGQDGVPSDAVMSSYRTCNAARDSVAAEPVPAPRVYTRVGEMS